MAKDLPVETPDSNKIKSVESTRRIRWLGLVLGGAAIAGTVLGCATTRPSTLDGNSWFAPYVDVTMMPTYAFDQPEVTEDKNVVLSFIVSSSVDTCTPSWGGAYSLPEAGDALALDRRIATFQQHGGHVAVSFGGVANDELAVGCKDPAKLEAAYKSVVDRYNIDTIDLDLEGNSLTDTAAGERRADALAKIQSDRELHGERLKIWATLPVAPDGLTASGMTATSTLLNKVDLAGVNVMTMNYGNRLNPGQSMADAAKSALTQTRVQLSTLYQRANKPVSDAVLWSKIGVTPMIGQNEMKDEIFTIDDAKVLNEFARAKGVGRMSLWSANRDFPCDGNSIRNGVTLNTCSGTSEAEGGYTATLSQSFNGNP